MNLDFIRAHCMSLPGTTEQIQWKIDLVFKIGGKMYCVAPTEGDYGGPSFKASDEEFLELIEREGIVPAPYMARAKWVKLEAFDTLPRAELKQRLTRAHELVKARLPKKVQAELDQPRKASKKKVAR